MNNFLDFINSDVEVKKTLLYIIKQGQIKKF